MVDTNTKSLKTEIAELKEKIDKIESFLEDFPNVRDYLLSSTYPYNKDEPDELYEEAYNLAIQQQAVSASHIQRCLQIGYARAARIIDQLEKNQVIAPAKGAKPRKVLVRNEK